MHRKIVLFGVLLLVGWLAIRAGNPSAASTPARAATLLPNVTINVSQQVAGGFNVPVQVTHAGDGSNRLFVVEQTGRIKIIQNGSVRSTPFLDLSGKVACCGERGLLSVAFHPNYEVNGYFYVYYTANQTVGPYSFGHSVVARYSVSGDANVANAASETVLLRVNQPYSNHNGGQLMFGPDGHLYVGLGDGGSGGDPDNYAQNNTTLLGSLLRLNVGDGSAGTYAIPADNPFVATPGADEIWAYGLRNPWRFSFDRATGDLYIGDVGQNAWEEIDFQAAGTAGGLNFGWRCYEGTHVFNLSGNPCTGLTGPILDYPHNSSGGYSVTGGFVYRGSHYPALVGRYFYADYVSGNIWSIYQTSPGVWSSPEFELNAGYNISSFGEDEQGELYVVDYGGSIRRLVDASGPSPNYSTSTKSASTPYANPGETITYTISLQNTGLWSAAPLALRDAVPSGLIYQPGTLTATSGTVDDSQSPILRWQGTAAGSITLTYRVQASGAVTGSLINRAVLTGTTITPFTMSHAISVPRPVITSTLADFFLPGTQPNQLTADIAPSSGCDFCHTDLIYTAWRGSLMSQAGRDPLFWAALAVANNDAPNAGEFCLRCHTPAGWLQGRSHPADGAGLSTLDLSHGIACEVCHRMVDPAGEGADEATSIDVQLRATLGSNLPPADHVAGAMLIVDPQDRRRGPFALNPAPPHPNSTYQTNFLGQSANPVTESRLCGSCHNIDNPLLSWDAGRGQFWPNQMDAAAPSFEAGQLFPIERTYDEWLHSDFAGGGVVLPKFAGSKPDGRVESCQDCHMPRTTGLAAESVYNPVLRDCGTTGCLPEHQLMGANTWVPQLLQDARWRLNSTGEATALDAATSAARSMLRRAATLSVTLEGSGAGKTASVRVTNDTGHKLPTGYPEGRRMWLHLQAFDAAGALVYESGVYTVATATLDSAAKIYEVKQGITPELAAVVSQPAGESFHFVLNNTTVKDNRIPPRGYTVAAFDEPGLRPVGATFADGQYWDDTVYPVPPETERVRVTLYFQTASREYIDFLRSRGGLDGDTLGRLWDSSPSPPEMMATAFYPAIPYYLPVIFK